MSQFLQLLPSFQLHNTTDELSQLKKASPVDLWDEDITMEDGGYNHISIRNMSYVELPDISNSAIFCRIAVVVSSEVSTLNCLEHYFLVKMF